MKILHLFIAAFIPVVKVLLVTVLGLFLAMDRVDLLGKEARKHLNNVSFYVFTPTLVGSSLSKYITAKSLSTLWYMPFNILITFVIGSALGWILLKITKPPPDLWGLVIGCCAAGNLGYLPLIIIPAICKERGSPFGESGACYSQGMAYISLSMALGAIYLWLYVYNIMRAYSRKNPEKSIPEDNPTENNTIKPAEETAENHSNSEMGQVVLLNMSSPKERHLEQLELDRTVSEVKPKVPALEKIMQRLQTFAQKINLKKLFAPSTIGAIIGFMVGIVPPFRKVFIGNTAPLRVIEDSASLVGDAAIPTVTLIVGANLLRGLKQSRMHLPLVIGIIVIRFIALPITGMITVKAAVQLGLVKSNPLYEFVLLLQFAVPPAINIGTISQLFGTGKGECSVIMVWTYAVSAISLTFWTAFFLWFVK